MFQPDRVKTWSHKQSLMSNRGKSSALRTQWYGHSLVEESLINMYPHCLEVKSDQRDLCCAQHNDNQAAGKVLSSLWYLVTKKQRANLSQSYLDLQLCLCGCLNGNELQAYRFECLVSSLRRFRMCDLVGEGVSLGCVLWGCKSTGHPHSLSLCLVVDQM